MTDNLALTNRSPEPIKCLICQNRTCRKQGAADVLAAFRAIDPPHISFEGCGCLGKCGNGAMVLVLPVRIWYYRVHPQDVPKILAASIDKCESS